MTTDQMLISGLLVLVLIMFAWGRWRHDIVAMSALILAALLGLIPYDQAFNGFSHPAVITVAAVLIISHALKKAGVVNYIAAKLSPHTHNQLIHIGSMTLVVTVASAFMNNVGALALMLPVAIATANKHNRSPALLLMPLAFGSILGGMTTMIGTPPNIIIATFRAETAAGEAFSLFDFSPVGVPVALIGVIFVALIGWRLLPKERLKQNAPTTLYEVGDYITELKIPENSPLVGTLLKDLTADERWELSLVGVAHPNSLISQPVSGYRFRSNDILISHGKAEDLSDLIAHFKLELQTASGALHDISPSELSMFEGIVSNTSMLIGRGLPFLRRRSSGSLSLLGLSRSGEMFSKRLRRVKFKVGDVLLLQGKADETDNNIAQFGLLPLAPRELSLGQKRKLGIATAIFAAAIVTGLLNLMPLYIAFLIAVFAYIVLDILPVRNIYDEIDWPVIILLGAMIPVGQALENTGTTIIMANSIVDLTGGLAIPWILLIVLVITMFLSDIINNAATVLVMAPISISLANQLQVNTDPFLMAVAVGASCAFLTPIGHQSNTLVMGPGGYKFSDYWRMGLPLEIIIVAVSVPLILWAWPLYG